MSDHIPPGHQDDGQQGPPDIDIPGFDLDDPIGLDDGTDGVHGPGVDIAPDPTDPTRPPGWPLPLPGEFDADGDIDFAPPDVDHEPTQGATTPESPEVVDPVELDLEEPLEAGHQLPDDGGEPSVATPGDATEIADPAPPPDESPDQLDVVLPLDGVADLESYVVAEGNGLLDDVVMAAGLGTIGAAASIPMLSRLRRPTSPDTVALLDSLGIDARVEHGDLTTIEERLGEGASVMLATDGSAGTDASRVLHVRAIDRVRRSISVVDGAGRSRTIDLERFEAAWADSANQLVVAAGDGASVALLPVVLTEHDFASA